MQKVASTPQHNHKHVCLFFTSAKTSVSSSFVGKLGCRGLNILIPGHLLLNVGHLLLVAGLIEVLTPKVVFP